MFSYYVVPTPFLFFSSSPPLPFFLPTTLSSSKIASAGIWVKKGWKPISVLFSFCGEEMDNGYPILHTFFSMITPIVSLQKQVLEIGIRKVPSCCPSKGQEAWNLKLATACQAKLIIIFLFVLFRLYIPWARGRVVLLQYPSVCQHHLN